MIGWNVAGPLGKGYKKVFNHFALTYLHLEHRPLLGFKFMSNHNYMPKGKCDGLGTGATELGNGGRTGTEPSSKGQFVTWEP